MNTDKTNPRSESQATSVITRRHIRSMLSHLCSSVFIGGLVLLCSSADAAAPAASAPAATDWPLFRGDAQATGVARSTLPDQPELLWKQSFKDAAFEACAIIVGDVIYVGSAGTDGDFYALELASGAVKWKFHTEYGFVAAAAYRDGRIYVGDNEGRCYCLDAAKGDLLWKHETKAAVHSGPNFFNDKVLFTSEDGGLYVLNTGDGKLAWSYSIDEPLYCSPSIAGDRVFLGGCDSNLHVVDLNKGTAVAKLDIGAQTGNAPAVKDDRVYFGTLGAGVLGIDWKAPSIAWTFAPSRRKQEYKSSAALSNGLVLLGGQDRQFHAIDAANGEEKWSFPTKSDIESSPVVVGERVFFGGKDGKVYGLAVADGSVSWEYESGTEFVASPAVAAGRLVIGDVDGVVYCFGKK
jgi:outer membrane protein assembly factor BamB